MRYIFLTDADLAVALKDSLRSQLVQQNTALIAQAEREAVEWVASYLQGRYDVEAIFYAVQDFIPGTPYTTGAQVYHEGQFYLALQNADLADPNYPDEPTVGPWWRIADRRSALMRMHVVNVVLYRLTRRVAGQAIPAPINDAYLDTKQWLEAVKDLSLAPNLPKPQEPEESTDNLLWGSNPALAHRF